jgi:hypothetical protein
MAALEQVTVKRAGVGLRRCETERACPGLPGCATTTHPSAERQRAAAVSTRAASGLRAALEKKRCDWIAVPIPRLSIMASAGCCRSRWAWTGV